MPAILITGANGQLGTALKRCDWPSDWEIEALGRAELDLGDPEAIEAAVHSRPWAAVINAAAYTAVDKAESDIVNAWTVNALAPAALGQSCGEMRIPLLHVSTDYVFPGNKSEPWRVDDPVAPLGVYGASKLGGEMAIRTSRTRHVIIRTAWVVSSHGHNFVKTMLRLATERDTIRVVDDQLGSPTAALDLARVLTSIAVRLHEDDSAPQGTFHFSNAGAVSWAGFAAEIFRQSAQRGGPTADVERIATADYPSPAPRPANSVLSLDGLREAYGVQPRPWQDALAEILDELIGAPQ